VLRKLCRRDWRPLDVSASCARFPAGLSGSTAPRRSAAYSQSNSKTSPASPPPSQGQRPRLYTRYRSDQTKPRKRRQARIERSDVVGAETIDARLGLFNLAGVGNAQAGCCPGSSSGTDGKPNTINICDPDYLNRLCEVSIVVSSTRNRCLARRAKQHRIVSSRLIALTATTWFLYRL